MPSPRRAFTTNGFRIRCSTSAAGCLRPPLPRSPSAAIASPNNRRGARSSWSRSAQMAVQAAASSGSTIRAGRPARPPDIERSAAMRFSPLVERIAGSGTGAWTVHIEARRRQEAGEDIIFLTVGNPDQEPPALVIEATVAALRSHRTGYAPTVGYPAVRQAIAARVARRTGQACRADNVAVVPGAQGGLYCALQCLAGPGDEVIVPEPIYATYQGVVGASGARMVTVPLRPETGFHPNLDALAAAVTS